MTFDGWTDHLMREMLDAIVDDWFRVRYMPEHGSVMPHAAVHWQHSKIMSIKGSCGTN